MLKRNSVLLIILFAILLLAYYRFTDKSTTEVQQAEQPKKENPTAAPENSINQLTKELIVVAFVKHQHKLPDYYITKTDARKRGWTAAAGNLCKVLPGKAIGGDVFTNREKTLPDKKGRVWFEADLNYNCGRRNADRLLFSSDHLVYVTTDHYKTFQEK